MPILRSLKITIPEGEVLRLQGYTPGRYPRPALRQAINQQIIAANALVQPCAVYDLFKVKQMDNSMVMLDGNHSLNVGALAREWHGVEYLALAVCTIGPKLEGEVSRLVRHGDLSTAVFLDTAGSVATENLAKLVYAHLRHRAQRLGLNSSPRISPGHGDWSLSDQQRIFDLLHPARVDITLTHSFLMLPLKSVSFAVGLGKDLTNQDDSPCIRCDMVHCIYRRTS